MQALSERDRHIFRCVVVVDVGVPLATHADFHAGRARQLDQYGVEQPATWQVSAWYVAWYHTEVARGSSPAVKRQPVSVKSVISWVEKGSSVPAI